MPDNLSELQQAVQQRRLEHSRQGLPRWLILLDRLRRLTTAIGLLILVGVTISIVWPYTQQLRNRLVQSPSAAPNPSLTSQPVASQPAVRVPATRSAAPARTTAKEPPLDSIDTHKLGHTFSVGTWEYRVTGRQWRDTITSHSNQTVFPASGHKFLTLFLTTRNIGTETALLPPPRLAGLDGTRYEVTAKVAANAAAAGQPLAPSAQRTCQFTFEVPAAKRYKVVLLGNWLSDQMGAVEIAQ